MQGADMRFMTEHFDPESTDFLETVAEIINRYTMNQHEDNIREAIGNFLVVTGLADREDLNREAPVGGDSRRRIDLASSDLIIETKSRIGTRPGFYPDPEHVNQLDDYLYLVSESGHSRNFGILTDGRYWLLRIHGNAEVLVDYPHGFVLNTVRDGIRLYEWLRDELLIPKTLYSPTKEMVQERLSVNSVRVKACLDRLKVMYYSHIDNPSVQVKRELWKDLLSAALGEAVDDASNLDDLFLLHTYLSAVVGLAIQSAFGIDIRSEVQYNPRGLLGGSIFTRETGIHGVVESDFFTWPAELNEGDEWIISLTALVSTFDWKATDYDYARVLYEAIISTEERRKLGEYYTPDWLAEAVVSETVPNPLGKRIMDPACGSGTFLRVMIHQYIKAAKKEGWSPNQIVDKLRESIIGIDVHPVSVHLARVTWLFAAREVIMEADMGHRELTVPVYLGDSLQLRTNNGNLLGETQVTVEVPATEDGSHRFLEFPRGLVDQGDWFDNVMLRVAASIESDEPGQLALDEADIPEGPERDILETTISRIEELHSEGRNHIWAYYTRNLVRPIWLSTEDGRVDAIVGNPPWIKYSESKAAIREALETQSRSYNIWVGARFAPHQDIACLFYTRCVDLYLKQNGSIGMILPRSVLLSGQYQKWRTGEWSNVSVGMETTPWDLYYIEPNSFFPVPACVVFATKIDNAKSLINEAKRWIGPEEGPFKFETHIRLDSYDYSSPYKERSKQGATIVPRVLFFVDVSDSSVSWVGDLCQIRPRRSNLEKSPWRDLPEDFIRELSRSIENPHVYEILMGETLVPFALLDPLKAVLPIEDRWQKQIIFETRDAIGGVDPRILGERMRERWRIMYGLREGRLWEEIVRPKDLIKELDYYGKLSTQTQNPFPIRLIYTSSGRPTAAVLDDPIPLVDYTLFWLECKSSEEAHYLASIINSSALEKAVEPLMPKGQFGSRHLQKHLWNLPIPEYDQELSLHVELASLGKALCSQTTEKLSEIQNMRLQQGGSIDTRYLRRQIRDWLRINTSAQQVETMVSRLLEIE